MNINEIRKYPDDNIIWIKHCLERMGERGIKIADVKNCIKTGEIIEEYPDDFPNPSCLIFGVTTKSIVLHTVVGVDGKNLFIITAYYPTTDKFEEDLKKRREK